MTFTIKLRGATAGTITLEYLCDEHGRFEMLVDRGDSPDTVSCPTCGGESWWSPSAAPAVHTQFVVSATQGKWEPKPHPLAMDMQPGQKVSDWKKQRRAMWDQERKKRVMKMANE